MQLNANQKTHSEKQKPNSPPTPRSRLTAAVDWKEHLEALPLATWIADADGQTLFVNRAYRTLLGLEKNLVTSDWNSHLHPQDRQRFQQAWDHFLTADSQRFQEDLCWIRPDTGQSLKLALRAQKISTGQLQGWIRSSAAEQALATLEGLTHATL